MNGIKYIINTAKYYIGCKEGDAKHREIIDYYNKVRPAGSYKLSYSDAWCAAFVVAVFYACGMLNLVPVTAYVPSMVDTFIKWKRFKYKGQYTPKVGDIIFYDWNANNESDHVGIICKVNGNTLTVIEGNYSTSHSCATRIISTNYAYIRGYGIPDYSDVYTDYYSKLGSSDRTFINTLPELKSGSSGTSVKILQIFLNLGKLENDFIEVDGIFGAATRTRLIEYQKAKKLEPDGICGRQTWASFFA